MYKVSLACDRVEPWNLTSNRVDSMMEFKRVGISHFDCVNGAQKSKLGTKFLVGIEVRFQKHQNPCSRAIANAKPAMAGWNIVLEFHHASSSF